MKVRIRKALPHETPSYNSKLSNFLVKAANGMEVQQQQQSQSQEADSAQIIDYIKSLFEGGEYFENVVAKFSRDYGIDTDQASDFVKYVQDNYVEDPLLFGDDDDVKEDEVVDIEEPPVEEPVAYDYNLDEDAVASGDFGDGLDLNPDEEMKFGGSKSKTIKHFKKLLRAAAGTAVEGQDNETSSQPNIRGTIDNPSDPYNNNTNFIGAINNQVKDNFYTKQAEKMYEQQANGQFGFGGNRRIRRANKAFFGTKTAPVGVDTDYKFGLLGNLKEGTIKWDPEMITNMMQQFGTNQAYQGFGYDPGYGYGSGSWNSSYNTGWKKTKVAGTREKVIKAINNAADPTKVNNVALNNDPVKTSNNTEWQNSSRKAEKDALESARKAYTYHNFNNDYVPSGMSDFEFTPGIHEDRKWSSPINQVDFINVDDKIRNEKGEIDWKVYNNLSQEEKDKLNQESYLQKDSKGNEYSVMQGSGTPEYQKEDDRLSLDQENKEDLYDLNQRFSPNVDPNVRSVWSPYIEPKVKTPFKDVYNAHMEFNKLNDEINSKIDSGQEVDPKLTQMLKDKSDAFDKLRYGYGNDFYANDQITKGSPVTNDALNAQYYDAFLNFNKENKPKEEDGGFIDSSQMQPGVLQKFFSGGYDDITQEDIDFTNSKNTTGSYQYGGGYLRKAQYGQSQSYDSNAPDFANREAYNAAVANGLTNEEYNPKTTYTGVNSNYSKANNSKTGNLNSSSNTGNGYQVGDQIRNDGSVWRGNTQISDGKGSIWENNSNRSNNSQGPNQGWYDPRQAAFAIPGRGQGRDGSFRNMMSQFMPVTNDMTWYNQTAGPLGAIKEGYAPTQLKYSKQRKTEGTWAERKLGFNKDRFVDVTYNKLGAKDNAGVGVYAPGYGVNANMKPGATNAPGSTNAPTKGPGYEGFNADSNGNTIPDYLEPGVMSGTAPGSNTTSRVSDVPITPTVPQAEGTGSFRDRILDKRVENWDKKANSGMSEEDYVDTPGSSTKEQDLKKFQDSRAAQGKVWNDQTERWESTQIQALDPNKTMLPERPIQPEQGGNNVGPMANGMAYGGYIPNDYMAYGGYLPEAQFGKVGPFMTNDTDCTDQQKRDPQSPCYDSKFAIPAFARPGASIQEMMGIDNINCSEEDKLDPESDCYVDPDPNSITKRFKVNKAKTVNFGAIGAGANLAGNATARVKEVLNNNKLENTNKSKVYTSMGREDMKDTEFRGGNTQMGWDPNAGYESTGRMTTSFGKKGGSVNNEGDITYMSSKQIKEFLKNGGQLEFQ